MTEPVTQLVERTYLTMPSVDALRPAGTPARRPHLVPLPDCSVARWRDLYATIGAPWHWHDRDAWPDATLEARLCSPAVTVYTVTLDDPTMPPDAGFLELEAHADGSVEIAYLGLHHTVLGQGLGGWLVTAAVSHAFALGGHRVWLHTCTLDHPAALPNYLARGFTIERTETYTTTV